jgi:hypothetical protein
MTYTGEQITQARNAIKRAVAVIIGGTCGTAYVGVEVSDADAIRYIEGTTVDQLLKEAR